jgi:ATP adenylyltransferase
MEHLWAPWRMEYIKKIDEKGCIFCQKPKEKNDAANLILHQGRNSFIIMNRFPYNGGHMMVVPFRHVANLENLSDEERNEQFSLVSRCIAVLKEIMKPDGFNIGMNLGRIAGAGIDQHIHTHIVPRWAGDTNFMPVTGDIRIINESLADTYKQLVASF